MTELRRHGVSIIKRAGLTPSLRPAGEPCETGRDPVFLRCQLGKAAALIGESIPVARIVHVRQPQHDRAKAAFALGSAMAGDPFARRCLGSHALRITL